MLCPFLPALPDLGYVQGMSDLLAPLLVITGGDEVDAFWLFCGLMDRQVGGVPRGQPRETDVRAWGVFSVACGPTARSPLVAMCDRAQEPFFAEDQHGLFEELERVRSLIKLACPALARHLGLFLRHSKCNSIRYATWSAFSSSLEFPSDGQKRSR